MAENGRVVVGCSNGEENPDGAVVAYLTAGAALDQGRDVCPIRDARHGHVHLLDTHPYFQP
jgi:hypothetical protein